ncbi:MULTISPECIES: hypothetical protein [Bradyrhizobium]|uniref:hypothetical protein n=1 Tax=Bradyrhizobium TaxID=374 RepID=UPI00155E5265|nr:MULTISPECIES: hypothetical protein [Bradyrhizobium]MDD1517597.1 hypothetical protein [Bradyrhizobium sp. WBAH30]MDD1541906.1 hypothetical protein [Bradyrhizobium sp. WBAH41]MDD1555228.1 hypothetical protein [Bradyrhizobium sp. WBAH23]MDD1564059.1 hypothetical protein [Bradyrhizobium sp. WBAH33]MDD1587653.1 hypothetical protein [Bradyrhizobium sp. WBAH42]
MNLTPTLLTFCYVKDAFDKSGDLMLGLAPLFLPIALKLQGKEFEPSEFVREVQSFYGISMPEPVAEELAVRLHKAGYLRAEAAGPHVQMFFYKDDYNDIQRSTTPDVSAVEVEVDALIRHVRNEFRRVFPEQEEYGIEEQILSALANLNFSKELGESRNSEPEPAEIEKDGKEAQAIRIIVAEYIFEAKAADASRFSALLSIASGALLAQVVTTIKNPPPRGAVARQLTVFFDTPMVLQYLGFDGVEKQAAVSQIIDSLKQINAQYGVYRKNIDEMQTLLRAVVDSIDARGYAEMEIGRRITASSLLRTRAREILQNPDGSIKKAGLRIVDPSGFSEKVKSAVPSRFELRLTERIRPMGKVASREVDASAICDTVRQRQDNRASDFLKAFAIFVSPNASLIHVSEHELRESGLLLGGEISYALTMAQFSGILWIAIGAGGVDLPMKILLANCVSALATNNAIVEKMREIVSSLGEEEAREFEGIIANDRCAYYLTKLTIGGPVLLTKETGLQVFEELRRRVVLDAEKIAAEKYAKELAEKDQEHALRIDQLSAEFAEERDRARSAFETAQAAFSRLETKFEGLEQEVKVVSNQRESAQNTLVGLCRQYRRKVEFAWSMTFATLTGLLGFVAGQVGSSGGLPFWVTAIIGVLCGALGFHIVPNFIFGGFIERRGEQAFLRKARMLGIEPLAQGILEMEQKSVTRTSK